MPASGRTLGQIGAALGELLAASAPAPAKLAVVVDVVQYNSKNCFYVIADTESGEQVTRLPLTATSTAVGAVLSVEGLARIAATGRVFVADPAGRVTVVRWREVTQEGKLVSNVRLGYGDRVYVRPAAK